MQVPDSKRLRFHFMTEDDRELFFQLDQDPEVMRFITGGKISTREDIENGYIPRLKKYANQDRGWGLWGMNTLSDEEYIGWILVRPMRFFEEKRRDDDNLELGWRLFRSQWGKGYATEGATAVLDALRANNVASQYSAIADADNTASVNVMKKLGMTFQGQEVFESPSGEFDCVVYSRPAD